MKLYFRADGNAQIGTGHVMRCLSIALAARQQGVDSVFLLADTAMAEQITHNGFSFLPIAGRWNDLQAELPGLLQLVAQESIERLLVDSYFNTPAYMEALSKITRLAYIDDFGTTPYTCQTLVNYNLTAEDIDYEVLYAGTKTQLLLGPAYAPLRPEFNGLTVKDAPAAVTKILISSGGADILAMSGRIARTLLSAPELAKVEIHIVAGTFSGQQSELQRLYEQTGVRLFVHRNTPNMAGLMQSCDLAVSAGGSTLYELCACGIPTVTFAVADNQLAMAKKMEALGCIYAGDARNNADQLAENIAHAVYALAADANMRQTCSKKMRALLDGKGAARIAASLLA